MRENNILKILFIVVLGAVSLFSFPAFSDDVKFEKTLIGLTEAEAILKIEELGLTYDTRRVGECGEPNKVVGTIPPIYAGTSVPENEVITLKITTKTGLATVPDIMGETLANATIKLESQCFSVNNQIMKRTGYSIGRCGMGFIEFFPDGGVVDKIIGVSPVEGDTVQWTSTVTVTRHNSGKFQQTRTTWPDDMICP